MFKRQHERGAHAKRAGGRGPDGEFISSESAAHPEKLCSILAQAFTVARTGGNTIQRLPEHLKPSFGKTARETPTVRDSDPID